MNRAKKEAASSFSTLNTNSDQYQKSQDLFTTPQLVLSPYLAIQKKVVWFYVPMDKTQLMNGIDGQHGLSYVELRLFFRQSVFLHQQRHHIT